MCDPCRHLTRARRPKPASLDIRKVNIPGTVPAAPIVICTPVSERSITLHGRTANPPSKRIHAFAPAFPREALRCSLRPNLEACASPKNDNSLLHRRTSSWQRPARQMAHAHPVEGMISSRCELNLQKAVTTTAALKSRIVGWRELRPSAKLSIGCNLNIIRCLIV